MAGFQSARKLMKKAKRFPFLTLLRERLNLRIIRSDNAPDVPKEADFRRWIWHTIKNTCPAAEIGLMLADADTARRYNREFRNKDYATNVLSFALDEDEDEAPYVSGSLKAPIRPLRGDLILCPEVIAREAAEQHKNLHHHYAHLTIHGTLHLLGYDHIEEADAHEMEALEIALMHQLGYPNPYLTDE